MRIKKRSTRALLGERMKAYLLIALLGFAYAASVSAQEVPDTHGREKGKALSIPKKTPNGLYAHSPCNRFAPSQV